ncbi:hypothetical protein LCGC14_1961300, partial [marine sediment metagenome]
MNVKTTVILIVLLALGVGYALLQQSDWFKRDGDGDTTEDATGKLTPDVGKVVRLQVETPRAGKIVFVSRDNKWRLAEPVDAPATTWEVSSIVTTVSTLEYTRKYAPDDPGRPKDDLTSLSDPLKIVSFTDEKDNVLTLRVGRKVTFAPGKTYVQVAGDQAIYVVDVDLAERLAKSANDYRDKGIVDFDTGKAIRVAVTAGRSYQLVKTDDTWALDRPVAARADQDKV